MLHGWSDSSFSFSRVLPLLPAEWRAIVPDQRGHGESDRPVDGYTMEQLARDAIALLEALRIPRAVVVGHSMGSFVAQHVAALAPERVSHLVLVDSAVTCRHAEMLGLFEVVRGLSDPVDEAFIREFQSSTLHQSVPPEFFERVVAESLKLSAHTWQAVAEGLERFDSRGWIRSIRCPVLAMWGEKDGVFLRAQQDELLRHNPAITFKAYPEVGHSPHWEIPETFAGDLLSYCAS
jgi:pimeloyl-ACP methyl ester carboxylesterase